MKGAPLVIASSILQGPQIHSVKGPNVTSNPRNPRPQNAHNIGQLLAGPTTSTGDSTRERTPVAPLSTLKQRVARGVELYALPQHVHYEAVSSYDLHRSDTFNPVNAHIMPTYHH